MVVFLEFTFSADVHKAALLAALRSLREGGEKDLRMRLLQALDDPKLCLVELELSGDQLSANLEHLETRIKACLPEAQSWRIWRFVLAGDA